VGLLAEEGLGVVAIAIGSEIRVVLGHVSILAATP
jgi:hypothetical protein